MVALKSDRYLAVLLCIAACPLSHAEDAIPSAYRLVATEYGVPVALFYAIALAESGQEHRVKEPPATLAMDAEYCRRSSLFQDSMASVACARSSRCDQARSRLISDSCR